jgi:hypothetical protein
MTCDAAHPTGGYPVQPKDIGLLTMKDVSGNFVALNGPVDCTVKAGQPRASSRRSTTQRAAPPVSRVKLYVTGALDSVLNEAGTNDVSAWIIVRITAQGYPA